MSLMLDVSGARTGICLLIDAFPWFYFVNYISNYKLF